jgi:hypothetical protein
VRSIDFTQPGGLPAFQDTLAWMQQAHTEGIGALGLAFGSGDFATALTSTVTQPNPDQIDWTPGWFLWGGEPVWADAGTLTKGSGQAFFVQRTQIAAPTPLNPALYQDGSTHSPYLDTRAAFAAGTLFSPPPNSKFWGGYLWDFAARVLLMADLGWRNVGAGGEPPFLNGWANWVSGAYNPNPVGFKKERNGRVCLRGAFRNPTFAPATVGSTVFTLPEGYRPAHNTALLIPILPGTQNGADLVQEVLWVATDGGVRVRTHQSFGTYAPPMDDNGPAPSTSRTHVLDGLSFWAA